MSNNKCYLFSITFTKSIAIMKIKLLKEYKVRFF